jgi:predicted MFS family arabinose efflux permease
MNTDLKNYLVVTAGYWAFTLTDGAIRMLVVLYFHLLGYSPFEVAMLFLFYEFFGIVTNLVGGWMAARLGLNVTMHLGMAIQVIALLMLTVPDPWLSVVYVMAAQALSGIAKDLNKMSAKASVKTLLSKDADSTLFKWVAILTGSKNALKGVGFFLGALLLEVVGFRIALAILAGGLFIILIVTWILLPNDIGKAKSKPKFTQVFSNIPAINWLSAARFFLFGSRDVWFVVALPVFFYEVLHWDFMKIGGFMALWVIGYGIVQASAPMILKGHHPSGRTALFLAFMLAAIPATIALAMNSSFGTENSGNITWVLVIGLMIFGIVFAINSAVHSYLILAYSDNDKVSMNVGFYYMANAGGRLAGTVLSGLVYQGYGLTGCLWISAGFVLMTVLLSFPLTSIKFDS